MRRGRRPTRSTRHAATRVPGIWQATELKSASYDFCVFIHLYIHMYFSRLLNGTGHTVSAYMIDIYIYIYKTCMYVCMYAYTYVYFVNVHGYVHIYM